MDAYEKKYKEALEKARQLCAYPTTNPFISDLQDLFPELAESEDERMIQYFKDLAPFDKADELYEKYGFSHKDAIAWLEKQGEQKPSTDFSDIRTWKYIVDAVLTEKEGIGQYLDSPFTEEIAKKLKKRFGNIEQKPAEWSEEDKNTLDFLVDYLLDTIKKMPAEEYAGGLGKAVVLLKSLKDRVMLQPQPKQEWSEEDSEHINSLIERLDGMCKEGATFIRTRFAVSEDIDWLKSIRPQSQWKPSDEQIKQLGWIAGKNKGNIIGKELMSLYQDLKKLKE